VAVKDEEAQLKLEMIQTLLEPCDRATYGKRLKEAAEKLGKSKRTVQRLVKNRCFLPFVEMVE
jgi:putative transposase